MMIAAVPKPGPTSASGADTPENTTIAEITTPITLSPTIKPEASSTPSCFAASGRTLRSALVKEPAGDRADHDHQSALRRQINSKTNGQRWNPHVPRRA